MKYLLLLLILPFSLPAQEVEPIVSPDYAARVKKLKAATYAIDSVTYARNRILKLGKSYFSYSAVKAIRYIGKDSAIVSDYAPVFMYLTGSYSATMDIRKAIRLPQLQQQYVQGRAENGALQWRGAETGEMFSYGPALAALEFDGSTYNYDNYGRLVAKGRGSGLPAMAYDNGIFRTAAVFSQQFTLAGDIRLYGVRRFNFNVKLGNTAENTFVRYHNNTTHVFAVDAGAILRRFTLKGSYGRMAEYATNTNRSGFLNSVYENALLTPVSFANGQGAYLGNGQRSYSNLANNPLFLLQENDNRYGWVQQTGSFTAGYSNGTLTMNVIQSLLDVRQQDKEVYKPGTAFWPGGMLTDRNKHTQNYQLKTDIMYQLSDMGGFKVFIQGNYLLHKEKTSIGYVPDNTQYAYRRTTNDASLQTSIRHYPYGVEMMLDAGSRFYQSTTSGGARFLLPSATFTMNLTQLVHRMQFKMSASWQHLSSELPLNQSFSYLNLLQYTPEQALQYRPVAEVAGFGQLRPAELAEWTGRLELVYKYGYSLAANVYLRNSRNEVFPVNNNGQLVLQNLADIRKKGIELVLSLPAIYSNAGKVWKFSNAVSFNSYRNTVTRIKNGGDVLPLGGFSNVYTALVKDAPVGVVMGNDYVRDDVGRVVIGADGFPLAGTQYKVIANPNPDFIVKASNTIWWKKLSLGLDWEWKKGGTGWNGTQAALDYYGRSAVTVAGRNITGYVFDGVLESGHINDIPVQFYDATQPLEKSRWVRYGVSGVATDYVQKTDYLRLNNIQLNYSITVKQFKDAIALGLHVYNLLLWTPYQGSGFSQLLYEQGNTSGLDFFNLPAATTYGVSATLKF